MLLWTSVLNMHKESKGYVTGRENRKQHLKGFKLAFVFMRVYQVGHSYLQKHLHPRHRAGKMLFVVPGVVPTWIEFIDQKCL